MSVINFSIIIPYYNNLGSLPCLLDSIPEREDTEVIVIDDCSNENNMIPDIIKNKYEHIKWIRLDNNLGGGAARNIGLKYATGKWIIFADADDYFSEKFNEILNKYINDEADIIFFDIKYINLRGKEKKHRMSDVIKKSGENNFNNIRFRIPQVWSKLIKRELIKKNNISFEESLISNDVMFSTFCDFYAEKIKIDNLKIYIYKRNKNSLQSTKTVQKVLTKHEIICKRNHFLRQHKITPVDYDYFVVPNILYILQNGGYGDIMKMLKILLRYEPKMMCLLIGKSMRNLLGNKLKKIRIS